MADEPVPELDGQTPLQAARTPGMDTIAREGRCGTLLTLPDGYPTSSEVANMSVLGCDLESEYCGRGPLEAAGRGIALRPGDCAFRLNLTTVEQGVLKDFSGGHVDQASADAFVACLNRRFGSHAVRFYPGVSYRCLLVLSGPEHSPHVRTEKPDDHQGDAVAACLPAAMDASAEYTALFLRRLMTEGTALLEKTPTARRRRRRGLPPVNGLWPWSGGQAGALRSLRDKYGIRGAVISAVDVINGLGKCLGMDVIRVQGATGYTDTNYRGKALAAVRALRDHDLVYLHLEAIDEVSHEQDLQKKIQTIEAFDAEVISPVLGALDAGVTAVVLPDHPVPVRIGRHTREPVPVAVRNPHADADRARRFDEIECRRGSLGALRNGDLMNLLFRPD